MASEIVSMAGIAGRYASAIFDLAVEKKALDKVASDLSELQTMLAASNDLRLFVASPVMNAEEQGKGIAALAKKAKFDGLTVKFLGLLAKKRRLASLPGMISAFKIKLAEHRGEVRATVTAPVKLTDAQVKGIASALKKATGSDVVIEDLVDPALLGGLVVQVGSVMVDSSLRTKLQRLELAMKGVA